MPGPDAVFRALSDPTRREIVKLLRKGPLTSGQIADQFPSAWATVSRHLAILKEADLVNTHRNGNSISYELNVTVLQELMEHILDWTRPGGRRA